MLASIIFESLNITSFSIFVFQLTASLKLTKLTHFKQVNRKLLIFPQDIRKIISNTFDFALHTNMLRSMFRDIYETLYFSICCLSSTFLLISDSFNPRNSFNFLIFICFHFHRSHPRPLWRIFGIWSTKR